VRIKAHLIAFCSGWDVKGEAISLEDGRCNLEDGTLNLIQDCIGTFIDDLPSIEGQVQGCHGSAYAHLSVK